MKKIAYLFFAVIFIVSACNKEEDENLPEGITYEVAFNFNWNATDFPSEYPSNAHFSKLVGWSHNTTTDFLEPGTLASTGIENMAETGGTESLCSEINAMIADGVGHHLVIGDNLGSGSGTVKMTLVVDEAHPEISIVTMIAPSPDWYVAVIDVNLLENGSFVSSKTITAQVYDAGTDSGLTYTAADEDTDPKEPIYLFYDSPLGNGDVLNASIASVTFSKK